MPKGKIGQCKMMDTEVRFVKSHLIPRALTPPRSDGVAFPQFGGRRRPSRRFDSWYDLQLVGQEGEAVLAALDTCAIDELRRLKLVWQSFGPMLNLSTSDHKILPGTTFGIRRVIFQDAARVRLFFLSLLWRAAASERPEFSEIFLPLSDLLQLRDKIRDGVMDTPLAFFPITLTQIRTLGPPHNHAPIAQTKGPFRFGDFTTRPMPIFLFYFDGLVAHIHHLPDEHVVDSLGPMLVGQKECTTIGTVPWDTSWQNENLAYTIADAEYEFPGGIQGADGLPGPWPSGPTKIG